MSKQFKNDDFDRLFKYMVNMEKRLNDGFSAEFNNINQRLDTVQNSLDFLVGEYKKLSDE